MKHSVLPLIAFASFIAVSGPILADDDFSSHKKESVAQIDARIAKMQEHRGCVNGAATKEAMHECHEKMKVWNEAEKKEHGEKRRARIDERIQRLENEKKNLAPK